MFIIHSKALRVIVFKAHGMPNLRIFPGHNTVNEEGFKNYFEDNKAAQAQQKDYLSAVEPSGLSSDEKIIADRAKTKNDDLNKVRRINAENEKRLEASDTTVKEQAKIIKSQGKKLEDQDEQLKAMQESIEALQATMTDPAETDPLGGDATAKTKKDKGK